MNRTLTLATLLTASLFTAAAAPLAQAQAAPAPAAAPAPQAIPAKVALIAFEQAVFACNEGQVAALGVQKKYEPRKAQIEALAAEVEALKKQAAAAPATTTDEEKAARLRSIDIKEKELNHQADEATTEYNADLQEALGKVAAKLSVSMKQYAQSNGYTLLLDVSSQQSNVLWALQTTEITAAVVEAYNKASGIAAPPPQAPAARPRTATPPAK